MGGQAPPGAPSVKMIQYFHTQVLCVVLSGKVIFTVHKTKTKKNSMHTGLVYHAQDNTCGRH